MARIVCQVLHRRQRITFLWSQGSAAFEPYHLDGNERDHLPNLSRQIHALLAEGRIAELANLGQQLYRAIFPAKAAAVEAWFTHLDRDNQIEKLEIVSDVAGLIPWSLVCENTDAGFWGSRFHLGVGRRVNMLRLNSAVVKPIQLAAVDPDLVGLLSAERKAELNPWRDAAMLIHTSEALSEQLKKQSPDVLMLLVPFKAGNLRLGADTLSLADLQNWIETAQDGNPDPIIILMGVGAMAEQAAWQGLLDEASAKFAGLIANEVLLPTEQAFNIGQEIARRFVAGSTSVGEILRSLRQEGQPGSQAFSAFCPPQVRVVTEGSAAESDPDLPPRNPPLPDQPYRPFAAFTAEDRALFVGRDLETLKGGLLLDCSSTDVLVVHGGPSAGKTSYVQAGLLPSLEDDSIGYRVLRDRSPLDAPVAESDYPILVLRATDDLAGQFADALSVFCAQAYAYTTPAGASITVDLPRILHDALSPASTAIQAAEDLATVPPTSAESTPRDLWIALRDQEGFLAKIVGAISEVLPFELVIAIDQIEELIALVDTPLKESRRKKALAMLTRLAANGARVKLVLIARSQAMGEFVSLLPGGRLPENWHTVGLRNLDERDLVEALLWPTNQEPVRFADAAPAEQYRFAFEQGLAQRVVGEALLQSVNGQQSPLALVQAAGAWLYDRVVLNKRQGVIAAAELRDLGSVGDALQKQVDAVLERLAFSKPTCAALRQLMGRLAVSHADGTLSRELLPAARLADHWPRQAEPVFDVVTRAGGASLFDIQQLLIGGEVGVFVSLPQDSLARLGRQITEKRALDSAARTRVVDMLWIMIPLIFLAAAMSFWFTRHYGGELDEESLKKLEQSVLKKAQPMIEQEQRFADLNEFRRPLYAGLLAQADQAMRTDNALRARELLLSQPAMRSFSEEKNFKLPDLRGFEWHYLWRSLNSERYRLEGHRGIVHGVAVSPDGKLAASCGATAAAIKDDSAIRLWDLKTGTLIAKVPGPLGAVHAVAFAPDGKTLASAGDDKFVRLWEIGPAGFKLAKTLKGHDGPVHAVAFGKDGETLASGGADQAVIVWDVAAERPRQVLKEHAAAVSAIAFAEDGKTLISAGAERTLIFWDAAALKKRDAVKTPFHAIAALAVSPDGKTLCAGGSETRLDSELGIIRAYQTADAKEIHKPIQHGAGVLSLAFAADGTGIVSGGRDHVIRLFDLAGGAERRKWIGHLGAIDALAMARDGSALVSGSHDQLVKAWDPGRGGGPDVIAAHADWVQALALDPKGTMLASGARDGAVKLWNAAGGKLLAELPRRAGAVASLAFSFHKDGPLLAVGTRDEKNDGELTVWHIALDPKTGPKAALKHTLAGHKKAVAALAFCPAPGKASVLVSGSADRSVKLWNVDTGKETESYPSHADEVRCLAFNADGQFFASGGRDRRVCIYELGRKEFTSLKDLHLASIESLALIPLPKRSDEGPEIKGLLTASADQSMRLWLIDLEDRLEARREWAVLRSQAQPLTSVLFSAPNALIASASMDGTIKLFDLLQDRFTLIGHSGPVRAIVMAPDQSFLASAGNDGTVRIWRGRAEAAKVNRAGEKSK